MPSYRITLAYDGTDFVGWQRQASGTSVQGLLEDALRVLDGRDVTVHGAGRTDAGVHALGQVASFTIERALAGDAVVRALNARLPDAVRVLSADEAPADFHARFAAREKTYRYRIWHGDVVNPFERRYAWHVHGALNVEAMQAAARLVEGRHDVAAFQATGSSVVTTVREVTSSRVSNGSTTEGTETNGGHGPGFWVSSVDPDRHRGLRGGAVECGGALIAYEVTGTGFLRHMVRILAGTLVEIGRGRHPADWMSSVLESRDRGVAGPTAPPEGLFLVRVSYGARLPLSDKSSYNHGLLTKEP